MSNPSRYRRNNDRSLSSRTYHKKDGTAIRAILTREASNEIVSETDDQSLPQTRTNETSNSSITRIEE
jgi:hypothetical protein